MLVDGVPDDSLVILGPEGIHIITGQGEVANTVVKSASRQEALDAINDFWTSPTFWNDMRAIGDGADNLRVFPTDGKPGGVSKQMGFEITPQMREKAMGGLPLFQRTGGERRGYFDRATNTMGLTNADASTVVHEQGHMFLDMLAEFSAESPALAKDLQTTLEWFGLKDKAAWDALTPEQQRPYHEKWARGFERYNAEGNAPTTALERVFERFKQWMIDLYKTLDALHVDLNDDIRGVMARLMGGHHVPEPTGDYRTGSAQAAKAKQSLLFADIAKLGGIDGAHMKDILGDRRNVKGLPPGMFKEGGLGIDDLAAQLRDEGWDIPDDVDGGVQAVRDLISAEVGGARAIPLGTEGSAAAGQQSEEALQAISDRFREMETKLAEQYDFDAENADYQAEVKRLRIRADLEMAQALSEQGNRVGAEARRFVAQNGDLPIQVGVDANGNPIVMTAREYLDRAMEDVAQVDQDLNLLAVAAECLLGAD